MNNCIYTKTNSDGYYTTWKTQCGKSIDYAIPDDYGMAWAPLPTDNGNKYCSYCGKEIKLNDER